jgi:hypothetical protein
MQAADSARRVGKAMFVCVDQKLYAVADIELVENGSQVMAHSRFAYKEAVGNLFILDAFAYQRDNFSFSIGERGDLPGFRVGLFGFDRARHFVENARRRRRVDPRFAAAHYFDSAYERVGGFILWDYAHRAKQESFFIGFGAANPRQYYYSRGACSREQIGDDVCPARIAKIEIKQYDVGIFFGRKRKRFCAIARLSDYAHLRLAFDDKAQACANHPMVVYEKHAYTFCGGFGHSIPTTGFGAVR